MKKIQPIEDEKQITRLRALLRSNPRDLLLFDMCTQTGLPLQVLLSLKVSDLKDLKAAEPISAAEDSPKGRPVMTERVYQTFQGYLKALDPGDEAYLFRSQKSEDPLTVSSVSHLVKKWFTRAGLTGLSGVKTLRKTWELHSDGGAGNRKAAPARPRSVRTSTLGQKIRNKLARQILAGQIAPGQRLRINRIASEMKVSPIPVRDALARLEASGFVTWTKRTYVVNGLSKENVRELLFLRHLLEPVAAEDSCENFSETRLNDLRRINDKLKAQAGRLGVEVTDDLIERSRQFHFTLYEGSQMRFLIEMIKGIWQRLSPYMYFLAGESKTYPLTGQGIDEHDTIISAYANRDKAAIADAIRADISLSMSVPVKEFLDYKQR